MINIVPTFYFLCCQETLFFMSRWIIKMSFSRGKHMRMILSLPLHALYEDFSDQWFLPLCKLLILGQPDLPNPLSNSQSSQLYSWCSHCSEMSKVTSHTEPTRRQRYRRLCGNTHNMLLWLARAWGKTPPYISMGWISQGWCCGSTLHVGRVESRYMSVQMLCSLRVEFMGWASSEILCCIGTREALTPRWPCPAQAFGWILGEVGSAPVAKCRTSSIVNLTGSPQSVRSIASPAQIKMWCF